MEQRDNFEGLVHNDEFIRIQKSTNRLLWTAKYNGKTHTGRITDHFIRKVHELRLKDGQLGIYVKIKNGS